MTERWVCKRCFTSTEVNAAACPNCGLARGAEPASAGGGADAGDADSPRAEAATAGPIREPPAPTADAEPEPEPEPDQREQGGRGRAGRSMAAPDYPADAHLDLLRHARRADPLTGPQSDAARSILRQAASLSRDELGRLFGQYLQQTSDSTAVSDFPVMFAAQGWVDGNPDRAARDYVRATVRDSVMRSMGLAPSAGPRGWITRWRVRRYAEPIWCTALAVYWREDMPMDKFELLVGAWREVVGDLPAMAIWSVVVTLPSGWTRLDLTDPNVRAQLGVPADSGLLKPGTFFAYVDRFGSPLDSSTPVAMEITAIPAPTGATLDSLEAALLSALIGPHSTASRMTLPAGEAVRIEFSAADAYGVLYLLLVGGRKVLASCQATTPELRQTVSADFDVIMHSLVVSAVLPPPNLYEEAEVIDHRIEAESGPCPRCGESILLAAVVCRFCGLDLEKYDEEVLGTSGLEDDAGIVGSEPD